MASAESVLAGAVGEAHVRRATAEDAIDGVPPSLVVAPGSVEEVATCLRAAHGAGLAVVPRGGGSRIDWGAPPRRVDVVLDTTRLDRVLDHAAGDLVVAAQAGVRLRTLQERLAEDGQRLALDPPGERTTLGGLVATSASGPLRHRYGTPRDLLIGITVVLADGTVAHAGGRVVKNVAGYDLGKLFSGSFGTLGVVVETVFRLHPLPAQARRLRVRHPSPESAAAFVSALVDSSLVPSALDVSWTASGGAVDALFEGSARSVAAQAEAARRLAPAEAVEEGPAGVRPAAAGLVLAIGSPPATLAPALRAVLEAGGQRGLAATVAGRAAVVSLEASFAGGDADREAALVVSLRERVDALGGSVVVRRASPELKRRVDVWGNVPGGAIGLMRRVKERFDPSGTLAPARFVGGL
jgi:glycolate oxidase FAD binding subunit